MNKIFKKGILLLASGTLAFSSCNIMDLDPTGWYGEDVAYSSVEIMDYYVTGFYSLLYANAEIATGYLMDDGVSELVKYSWYGDKGQVNQMFYRPESFTPESNYRSNWASMYRQIRTLNEYFYDLSHGRAAALDQDQVKIRTAEVRFLRAFAYQELVIRHGGVVLRVAEDYVDGPEDRAKARSSEEACWDFIIKEYEKAAADLPEAWSSAWTGRVTKGAAIGMKARACLYAGRWEEAVNACNDVLAMNYALIKPNLANTPQQISAEYNRIYSSVGNSELLLASYFQQGTGSSSAKQHSFNNYFCAPGDDAVLGVPNAGVGVCATPSEEYASSFDIKVGENWEKFDWADLEAYNNQPYQNRDPRFYSSILYNGAEWLGRKLDLTKDGGNYMPFATSGQDNVHKTTTGYVFRKYLSDSRKINFTNILSGQYWIEMRLAEIYLIRSEAYARQNDFDSAYNDLNVIRARVGMPDRDVQASWELYLRDLSNERVCELGLEGHRWYDLVRWGKAVETLDGKRLHAVEITKGDDGLLEYNVVECDTQDRHFLEKMNIFPIPREELRNNSLCVQNEVWE